MDNRVHDKPSDVIDESGEVIQSGPDGVAVSFEPGAAIETGHRLIEQGLRSARKEGPSGDALQTD